MGVDFVALQVPDVEQAAQWFERVLGWTRSAGPPHAVVFDTQPIPVAVREPLDDLAATSRPGLGTSVWVRVDDTRAMLDGLEADEVARSAEQGPFGWTATIIGPAGHHLTVHDGDGQ